MMRAERSWLLSESRPLNDFRQTRDQYRSNADRAIALGEFRKASELLWGAVTQQLKALAAYRDIVITSHRQFFDFLRQYGVETGDRSLYEDFVDLNALHANFYDEIIPPDAFPIFYQRAIDYVTRLERLSENSGKT
jgi:Archaeal PaREP1/PaREP8 family